MRCRGHIFLRSWVWWLLTTSQVSNGSSPIYSLSLAHDSWHILTFMRHAIICWVHNNASLLHHLGFPKQHSAPQPYWATLVSRTCHGLPFHWWLWLPFFSISCLSFPPLPSWKILHSSNANLSPFWSLPWTQCKQPLPPPCTQRNLHSVLRDSDVMLQLSARIIVPTKVLKYLQKKK